MASTEADIARMRELRPKFHPLLVGLHWPSLPWGDEELGGDAVSFDAPAIPPVEQLIEAYAARIADTPASRTALETIFRAALRHRARSVVGGGRRSLSGAEPRGIVGSEGEGAAPGADREPFDPERLYRAAEAEPVSFGGGVGLGGILAPLRALVLENERPASPIRRRRWGHLLQTSPSPRVANAIWSAAVAE